MAEQNFKVIVIGAGIVGLTMANALERAGIDYVLFEKYPDILSPQHGAGVAMLPFNVRVLDQLGCFTSEHPKLYSCYGGNLWSGSGVQLVNRSMYELEKRSVDLAGQSCLE
jgi:2-polyprenyl-6-methoxyphenol hydroxylase-like FAD-dependent oxidoreductase